MTADQDVNNGMNGVDANNGALPWRWVRVRARTVWGNLSKLQPFNWPNPKYAASTSAYDALTGASEAVSWRYVDSRQDATDSPDNVVCLKDMMLAMWELTLTKFTPEEVNAAIAKAKVLRKWPTAFPGTPPYESGQ